MMAAKLTQTAIRALPIGGKISADGIIAERTAAGIQLSVNVMIDGRRVQPRTRHAVAPAEPGGRMAMDRPAPGAAEKVRRRRRPDRCPRRRTDRGADDGRGRERKFGPMAVCGDWPRDQHAASRDPCRPLGSTRLTEAALVHSKSQGRQARAARYGRARRYPRPRARDAAGSAGLHLPGQECR